MALISGECNSKGFYKYDNCSKACPDPELKMYLKEARNVSDVGIDSKVALSISVCARSQANFCFHVIYGSLFLCLFKFSKTCSYEVSLVGFCLFLISTAESCACTKQEKLS